MQEVGYVISNRDFIIYLNGLPTIKVNDMIANEEGTRGLISALYPDRVEALILDEGNVKTGDLFKRLEKPISINVGSFLIGRAINPLGVPIDGKGLYYKTSDNLLQLDTPATGINTRKFITEQFVTGITLIDSLVPLGKGQRELVMGDPHSGKTTFLIDLILNQRNTNTICIYASIGKPVSQVRNLIDILNSNKALEHTVIIAASSSEPAPLIFLAPQTAFTVAEYFQQQGKDVLLILDDLGNHAKIYREISLLGGRSPGRESYPGDMFYQHAHILERAGNYNEKKGGGSITAIPVIELNINDFTALIPTNLMGMTDGHLLFRSSIHNQGQKPAVDISLSVSRVGKQTQNRIHNAAADRIKQILAQAADLETVSKFSAELPFETQFILRQKDIIDEFIKQDSYSIVPINIQIILLTLVLTSFFNDKNVDFAKTNKDKIIEGFLKDPELSVVTKSIPNIKSEDEMIKAVEAKIPRLNQICGVPASGGPIVPQQAAAQGVGPTSVAKGGATK